MSPIGQHLLIGGTILYLASLLIGFAIPVLKNPRMGVSVHVAGLQSGMTLWAFGLLWQHMALPAGAARAAEIIAIAGLYAVFVSLLLAALWGTNRSTPIAGAGHRAPRSRELTVAVILGSGSVASAVATSLVLWGLSRAT